MITFDHVSKTYSPDTKAVEDFSLTIAPHTTTVFLGTSGCGKTTLMRMVNRMVTPSSGTVTVRGRDVAHEDPVALRRSIGYVLQDGGLFPHRTIVDNIATVPVLEGVSKASARADALKLMELVGLDPSMAKRYPSQLSGGQRQRVGVARALANRADILLMDEPFGASTLWSALASSANFAVFKSPWAPRSSSSPTTLTRPLCWVIALSSFARGLRLPKKVLRAIFS